ncbi:GNAT family N-acetyltransferase [Commensalibacter oyaizuii]|uniref:GNAT family N-acetyltransferase n=1 Tax=Commensalibacter oyaizuii TaxID=3043873 RepID=A0ABT6Q0J6_9PROT|nr:GNAT family N-acetyltransferase [Commensalibacter sp. TBRC 16381]MDI2090631.1 GNAT family N-acetyltransferase [Commensalibacter sp. TBRC 16381]
MNSINNIRPATPVTVSITFLRMDHPPMVKGDPLPDQYSLEKLSFVPIPLYRYIYNNVGRQCCWWMRRVLSDQYLQQLFSDPLVEVHVLKDRQNVVSGFFELDCRNPLSINIAYFGLMPHLVGQGLGKAFFNQVVTYAWQKQPACLRINTCNLDNPNALKIYQNAGFEPIKTETELWNIPDVLQLPIPKQFLNQK